MTFKSGLLLPFLFLAALQAADPRLPGHYRWGVALAPAWAYQGTTLIGPGPAIQTLFKYEPSPDASVSLKLAYTRQHAADHFTVRWYNSLTTTTDSAALSAHRTWTGLTFGPYVEKYFTFNWQTDDRKFLKNLFPYLGAGLDFHFIVESSSYSPPSGAALPAYLSDTYGSGTQLLPPTFGATLRIGSKVRLSPSGFLDLFGQYSALIPEETRKERYLNHHFFVGIGYEQEIILKPPEGTREKRKAIQGD